MTHTEGVDDVGFLRALIKDAVAQYGVDASKVYLYGFSNGGAMAMRMAWEASQEISAIAVIGMNMPAPVTCETNVKTPPIMFVAGTEDKVIPYQGGAAAFGGVVQSAPETAAAFGRANGLGPPDPESNTESLSSDPAAVRVVTWRRNGRPFVLLYTVRGGGHEIPRASQGVFDTPTTAWNFFRAE
jgi:polyhydroxybutyrate depolymerase